MGKKDLSITIADQWLELDKLKLPKGGSIDEAMKIVEASSIDIDFEVVVPKELTGDEELDFNFRRNAELKKLRTTIETRVGESMTQLIDLHKEDQDGNVDAYDEAKKVVDSLNSYIERCVSQLRPLVRAAIAKALGGKAKPEQLQTFGRVDFDQFEIRLGVFENEMQVDSPMLDLDKALKRKKWQQFGAAWKAGACVVSVKPKKDFKEAELKELREALPDGLSRGAKMIGGRFKAESGTKVVFEFPPSGKMPKPSLLRNAMKEQSGQAVHVTRLRRPATKEEMKAEENKQAEKNEPATAKSATAKSATAKTAAKAATVKTEAAKAATAKAAPPKPVASKTATAQAAPSSAAPTKKGAS